MISKLSEAGAVRVRLNGYRISNIEEVELQAGEQAVSNARDKACLLYTSPSPRDGLLSRMPSSA